MLAAAKGSYSLCWQLVDSETTSSTTTGLWKHPNQSGSRDEQTHEQVDEVKYQRRLDELGTREWKADEGCVMYFALWLGLHGASTSVILMSGSA